MQYDSNPAWNMVPSTAPGFDGLRHTIGDIAASMSGGIARPYVAPNQSVYEAWVAKHVNAPLYNRMLQGTYHQMGFQLTGTFGGTELAKLLRTQAGIDQAVFDKAMQDAGGGLGRGFVGRVLMPFVDSGADRLGLTGGSIISAANTIYAQRMNLAGNAFLLDPLNAIQQEQTANAASAVSTILNGLMSRTHARNGDPTLLPNLGVTQGLRREHVADLVMKAAGRGFFTSNAEWRDNTTSSSRTYIDEDGNLKHRVGYSPFNLTRGGLANQLYEASNGMDLSMLSWGDFSGRGTLLTAIEEGAGTRLLTGTGKKNIDEVLNPDEFNKRIKTLNGRGDAQGIAEAAALESDAEDSRRSDRMLKITRRFAHGVQGLVESVAAMRDLTHEIDGAEEKLDELTNGDWMRNVHSSFKTRDAVRTLHALSTSYNISSGAMLDNMKLTRATLQSAAGIDGSMLALGFSGGGLFGLPAQVELLADVESLITRHGVRGDPMMENRLRQQHRQVMAQSVNTMGGRGAQVLAFARQLGLVSDEEAEMYADALGSGDRGTMTAGINRLLTTVFGSAEAGRRFMNNQMQMTSMRQSMGDEAGEFAWKTSIRGIHSEFHERSKTAAAEHRLSFTKQLLGESGMRTWQDAGDVDSLVQSVVAEIKAATTPPGGKGPTATGLRDANAFAAQVAARIGRGENALAAFTAVKDAFARNPLTAVYTDRINRAVTQQAVANNEERIVELGRDSYQATAAAQAMLEAGAMTSAERLEVAKLVRDGNGKLALGKVQLAVGRLGKGDPNRSLFRSTLDEAGKRFDDARAVMDANAEAAQKIEEVNSRQYGASSAADAYMEVVDAARKYMSGFQGTDEFGDFLLRYSRSKFGVIFSDKEQEEVLEKARAGDRAYFDRLGRRAAAMKRMNVDHMYDLGHGSGIDGFFDGGVYSGTDAEAREERDSAISRIASSIQKHSEMNADDAKTLAQDLIDLKFDRKGWRRFIKLSGANATKEGKQELVDKFTEYAKAFDESEKTEKEVAYLRSSPELARALTGVAHRTGGSGLSRVMRWLNRINSTEDFYGGFSFDIHTDEKTKKVYTRARGEAGGLHKWLVNNGILENSEDYQAILDYVDAKVRHMDARQDLRAAVNDMAGSSEALDIIRPEVTRQKLEKEASEKLVADSSIDQFLSGITLDSVTKETTKNAALRTGLTRLGTVMADKDFKSLYGGAALTDEGKYKAALEHVKKKAAEGDADAAKTLRYFQAAATNGTQRISGRITLMSGNEQRPAMFEGTVGGLGG